MKQFLFLAGVLLFLSACTSPSVIVKNKREASMPYTRILAIYLEEGCDFSVFDSTAYNICLKSCFSNTEGAGLRDRVETRLRKHLATRMTEVLRSVDYFGANNCDYVYFRRTVDSLKVDAVLMVGLRSHSHDEREVTVVRDGLPESSRYKTLNAFFVCDLLNPRSLYMPVWRAEIEEKGWRYTGDNGLNRNMTKKLAGSLKAARYVAR
ncbi:MAG TPA: hypothetical protein VI233_18410 [Puia sp.]